VTKMDKKSVADTEFVVPPTYQVVDLAQMLGGLGAGGGLGGHTGGGHGQKPH